jgi:hypothetical protein
VGVVHWNVALGPGSVPGVGNVSTAPGPANAVAGKNPMAQAKPKTKANECIRRKKCRVRIIIQVTNWNRSRFKRPVKPSYKLVLITFKLLPASKGDLLCGYAAEFSELPVNKSL